MLLLAMLLATDKFGDFKAHQGPAQGQGGRARAGPTRPGLPDPALVHPHPQVAGPQGLDAVVRLKLARTSHHG